MALRRLLSCVLVAAALCLAPAHAANRAWLSRVDDIVSGPDASVWFSLPDRDWVAFLKPGGCMYAVNVARDGGRPNHLFTAKDGSVWFTLPSALEIGYLRENHLHYISVRSAHETPSRMIQSRDGSLWMIPSFGTRVLHIQDNAVDDSVTVSNMPAAISEGDFLPDGRLALIVGPTVKIVNLQAKRITRTVSLSTVPTKLVVSGDALWVLEPLKNRVDLINAGGNLRSIDLPSNAQNVATLAAALAIADTRVLVGTTGGIYEFSKDGSDMHRISVPVTGVVSILKVVGGQTWYGSYEGSLGYLVSDKPQVVELRNRFFGSALNCGSLVPSSWIQ